MIISLYIEMDKNRFSSRARYSSGQKNGKKVKFLTSQNKENIDFLAAVAPTKDIGRAIREIEAFALLKYNELKNAGAFKD